MDNATKILQRIIKNVIIEDGHWKWQGELHQTNGRAIIRVGNVRHNVSRILLELSQGALGAFHALHRCKDKTCVNLAHLYAGTPSQNMMDSVKDGTHTNAAKQTCPQGHQYDADHTRKNGRIERRCLTCRREQDKARRLAKKEK